MLALRVTDLGIQRLYIQKHIDSSGEFIRNHVNRVEHM